MRRVLDTSVVAKWFLQEEGSDRAELYLSDLLQGAVRVVVPPLMFYELASIFWQRRKDGLTSADAGSLWAELSTLPLDVTSGSDLLPQALSYSFRYEISPYDAVFVVLARNLGCDLVTADHVLWSKLHQSCSWLRKL